jgi:hypothetical protein
MNSIGIQYCLLLCGLLSCENGNADNAPPPVSNAVPIVIYVKAVTVNKETIIVELDIENKTTADMRISGFGLWIALQRLRFSADSGTEWFVEPDSGMYDPPGTEADYSLILRAHEHVPKRSNLHGTLQPKDPKGSGSSIIGQRVKYSIDWHVDCADLALKRFMRLKCRGSGYVTPIGARQ